MLRQIGVVCILAMAAWPTAAWPDEHKLEPGDVLEFSVVSLPNLRQRATIDQDGVISLPFMNGLHTEGFTISELRAKVQALTSAKPFRQRGADGKETLIMIDADEVSLNVVSYRPIYMSGDVAKPGEQQFRPGLTVRQALALSGGVDILHGAAIGSPADLPGLRSEADLLKFDIARQSTALARAKAEMADQDNLAKTKDMAGLKSGVIGQLMSIEQQRLALANESFKREKTFLQVSQRQASNYLDVLTTQLKNEKEGADLDASDYQRLSGLYKTGAVTISRVMDARRAMLLSSTRLLQTGAQRAQTEITRDNVSRQLEKLAESRQADLLKEVQSTEVSIAQSRLKLKGVEDRIAWIEGHRPGDGRDIPPTVVIYRREAGRTLQVPVDMESDVLPGDVVDVKLPKRDDELY